MADVSVDNRKEKSIFRAIVDEFFDSSTIHGVKYIGTRPLHEKLWWLIVFSISILICIYQIFAIYTKWKLTPVIITIDENFTPIGEIPFPAITFCGRFIFNDNQTQFNYNAFQTVEKMFSVDSSDFMSKCRGIESPGGWRCHRAFVKIVTRYGICMTFNMLQKNQIVRENVTIFLEEGKSETHGWNPETGYESKNPILEKGEKRAFPHRTFTVGRKLVAKVKSFYSGQCLSNTRVFVHHPYDFPWDAETALSYPDQFKTPSILVTPEMMKTSLGLRDSLTPDKRNCFFDGERNLKFFKIYSKSNCELECLTNITLDQCKCVQFWMPRHPDTPICGISHHKCSNFLALRYLNINIATTARKILEKYDIPYKCNCLERCNSVTYSAKDPQSETKKFNDDDEEEEEEVPPIYTGTGAVTLESGVPFSINSVMPSTFSPFVDEKSAYNISFKVQFEKSKILSFKRIAPYEISDFIANCGGLLGLFMGISLLSFVEIIYFCTFRLVEAIVSVKKDRSQ
ncbi:pickpocket protein 28-like [Culicoides brevitarsis]|uniref:pickpocket protein 28-like n=1 Tax=Culicoides brevitarsis TaxID=469753 RepID=UPI00307B377F